MKPWGTEMLPELQEIEPAILDHIVINYIYIT